MTVDGVASDSATGNWRQTALALMAVSQARLEGHPTTELLCLTARSAREVTGATIAAIFTPLPAGPIAVRVADGPPGVDATSVASQWLPLLDVPADYGMSSQSAGARQLPGTHERGPLLITAMVAAEQVVGAFALVRPARSSPFDDGDLVVAEAFAREAAMTLQQAELREELERLALLEERERIAMDLHDGVVQALFVVGLSLQDAESVVGQPDAMRDRLAHAIDSIDRTIRNLRDYIFGLKPTAVADRYLERTLRELAEGAERSGRVTVEVELDSQAAGALATRSATVVQAAREAISNAIQHSGGDRMTLRLVDCGSHVMLEVVDNGRGFAVDEARGRGNGLENLQARADDLGGTLEIDSQAGRGTHVRFLLPG